LPDADADPVLFKQVLVNLLSNALKFTRPRPVAHIEISSYEKEGKTIYVVKDNGVGFDPEQGDKLFGVFQRLHSEDEFEGTGVGLALVERIVRRHGGYICAESAPDQGATFFVTLVGSEETSVVQGSANSVG
jgi:signal transduction histidine kinase